MLATKVYEHRKWTIKINGFNKTDNNNKQAEEFIFFVSDQNIKRICLEQKLSINHQIFCLLQEVYVITQNKQFKLILIKWDQVSKRKVKTH